LGEAKSPNAGAIIQDFLKALPTIAAVVMSVLTIIQAVYPPQARWAKAFFTITIVALGAFAVVALLLVQRRESAQRTADEARHKAIREQLGVFIVEGQELVHRCTQEHWPVPDKDANSWTSKIEAFLAEKLGPSYVAGFRNDAGLPLTASSGIESPAHRKLWAAIHSRVARLEQFSEGSTW